MKMKGVRLIANKINLFLLEMYHAGRSARNTFSLRSKYADPSAYWEYRNLQKKGCIIRVKTRQGKHFWKLTTRGMKLAELLEFKFGKKKKWDKRWRIIVFDVPKGKDLHRDFLRRKLKELDFYQLQQSVWVTPYPLPTSLAEFIEDYKLAKHVRCLVVEEINFDKDLHKHFQIK